MSSVSAGIYICKPDLTGVTEKTQYCIKHRLTHNIMIGAVSVGSRKCRYKFCQFEEKA